MCPAPSSRGRQTVPPLSLFTGSNEPDYYPAGQPTLGQMLTQSVVARADLWQGFKPSSLRAPIDSDHLYRLIATLSL